MHLRIGTAILLVSATAWADFSYQQTSRVTGGAMAGMMKMAGSLTGKGNQPVVTTVMVRGDRMATATKDNIQIIDLAKETMTDVNLEKKTYSVLTFAEFSEAMKRLAQKMGQVQNEGAQFKADVKQTGNKRDISGFNTEEYLVTLTMEATDKKSGQSGSMDMQMTMWMAPSVAGYSEVKDFYRRMVEKMDWSPMQSMAGPLAAQNGKGMAQLAKEMSKLDGLPILQITKIGTAGAGGAGIPSDAEVQSAQQQQEAQPAPTVQDAATDAATRSAASAVMGRKAGSIAAGLGGFGGFGRKKKPAAESAPAPAAEAAPAAAPAPKPTSSGPAALMELTTEMSSFNSSVDASKMEVPSGFRQVESEMKKALK